MRETVWPYVAESILVLVEPVFTYIEHSRLDDCEGLGIPRRVHAGQYAGVPLKTDDNALHLLALLVLLLAVLRFERVVRVLLNLLFDDFLQRLHVKKMRDLPRMYALLTDACDPEFLRVSISSSVNGWTN